MSLSREQIIDYAKTYVQEDQIVDFPQPGELFALLTRDMTSEEPLREDEGWKFESYGICLDYTLDHESKPEGKWIWMNVAALQQFPPWPTAFRLQPPHIATGRFSSQDRTNEIRIVKMGDLSKLSASKKEPDVATEEPVKPEKKQTAKPKASGKQGKVLKFRMPSDK